MMTRLSMLALVLLTAAPALADPAGDLKSAFAKLEATKTYRTTITAPGGMIMHGEVEKPGRSHMTMPGMETITIGETNYLKAGGTWRTSTSSVAGVGDAAIVQRYGTPTPAMIVRDLGSKTVDGVALHAYSVQQSATATPATIYIDGGGNVARIETAGPRGAIAIQLSDFNAPITIVAPL